MPRRGILYLGREGKGDYIYQGTYLQRAICKNLEVAQIHISRESPEQMMPFNLTRQTANSEGKEREGWDLQGNIKSSLSLIYYIEIPLRHWLSFIHGHSYWDEFNEELMHTKCQ